MEGNITNSYVFSEKERKCWLNVNENNKDAKIISLPLIKNNSFQWVFKHDDCDLIIEKLGSKIITACLKNVKQNPGTIRRWEEKDRGRAVLDKEKGDYVLKYGLPKIFYLFIDYYYQKEPRTFQFDYAWHLVLKDKDERKPYYWYQWDYTTELNEFVYNTLSSYIKPEDGQIVAIPGEQGETCYPWGENHYFVNFFYCGEDEENKDYDFSKETAEGWNKKNYPPALAITFLPTYFNNYELERGEKLTGTTWMKKIWEVFGIKGVPIVVKCYRAWVFTHLYRYYRSLYDQISSITELPTSIDQREVGSSNLLVYFNCPFLNKKTPYTY